MFPIVTLPFVMRSLGPTKFGEVSIGLTVVFYFSILINLGIPIYGFRELSKIHDSGEKNIALLGFLSLICITSVFYSAIFIMITMSSPFFNDKYLYLFLYMYLLTVVLNIDWYFQVNQEYRLIAIASIISKSITLFLLIFFLTRYQSPKIYILILTLGNFIYLILCYRKIATYLRGLKLAFSKLFSFLKSHLSGLSIIFLATLGYIFYINFDIFLIGAKLSDTSAGHYSAGSKIIRALSLMIAANMPIFMGTLTKMVNENTHHEKIKFILNKNMQFSIFLAFPIAIFGVIYTHDLIYWLLGPSYLESVVVFKFLFILLIFSVLNNFISAQVMIPFKLEKNYMIMYIIAAVLTLILNALFLTRYGIISAAGIALFIETTIFIYAFLVARKNTNLNIQIKTYLSYIIAGTFAILTSFACAFIPLHPLILLILKAIVFGVIYFICLYNLKDYIAREVYLFLFRILDKSNIRG